MIRAGNRLGPYEIVSPLGAGGMGEVWRARDTRLDRDVAVKILPAEFAANAQLKLRFEREAKTISQLEHPNICRLYDVGESPPPEGETSSVSYLVMELLEGESLADRLAKGPLPLGDVFKYGIQIADALDRAHRSGIVHRDLKPGNIMITKSGAKLLDFGLAKPQASLLGSQSSVLETQQKPLTEQGTIVGTFQYMSPEQVTGSEADARSDIFALGVVLYEMATGRRAFEGKTRTSLVAAIVTAEPKPISEAQPLAPPALEHVILKCLAKEADDRWQSAHDIASELRWISEAGSQAGVAPSLAMRRVNRERIAWAFAAVAALAAIAATIGYVRRAPQPQPARRFVVAPPPHCSIVQFDELGLALAPDGQRMAFVAIDRDGRRQLWLRSFSEFEAKALPETGGASYPFWSPDGRFIAFFAEGKLKKIDSADGPPQVICDAATGRGGSWGPDGTILFAPNVYSAIYAVGANGGTPKAVTRIDAATEVTHRWPQFLPDGKHFFYIVRPKTNSGGRGPGRLMLASLGSASVTKMMEEATNTVYSNGFLLFGREQRLMAQRFDLKSMKLSGDPMVLIGEKLSFWEPKNFVVFSATDSGSLVYLPETPPLADLRIVSREGRTLESVASNALLNAGASFSPDGSLIAYSLGDPANRREDIWIYDIARKRSSRFTFQPASYWAITWSRDASRLYFAAAPQSMGNIYSKPLKGSAAIQPVVENGFWKMGADPSPDGRVLAYTQQSGERGYDLWTVRPGQKPEMFLGTSFDEVDPKFSPDGRWIAYTSNESGRFEVYVRPAAGTPDQWQVSSAGGQAPRWSAGGGELFYIAPDGKLFSVPVQAASSFDIGEPKELFVTSAPTNFSSGPLQDVSADGQRLLVSMPADAASASMRVVFNWPAGLQKQTVR